MYGTTYSARASRCSLGKKVAQDHGAIMPCVVSAVEERNGSPAGSLQNGFPTAAVCVELTPITSLELFPAFDAVVEPFPQLRARRDFLQPLVRGETSLGHSSRPETLDQNSPAIAPCGWIVRALDLDHGANAKVAGAVVCDKRSILASHIGLADTNQEFPQNHRQNPAVSKVLNLDRGIDPHDRFKLHPWAVLTCRGHVGALPGSQAATDS